jgi:hypothetical protein
LVADARGIEEGPSLEEQQGQEGKDGSESTSIERRGQQQEERRKNDNVTTALLPTIPIASSHM